jgi:hypothetical protein
LGFIEKSVTLASSGNIGVTTLYLGDDVPPPPLVARDFEVDILPIFSNYGCVGCHYAGGNGAVDRGGYLADFAGTPQDVYDNLVGPGLDCTLPDSRYRVCVNYPTEGYLITKPLQEPIGVQPNHPNASFETLDDPYVRRLIEWSE